MSDGWPGRAGVPFAAAPPPPPHRLDIGGEWASLLAEVDAHCGPDTARRIDALARSWAARQEVSDEQAQARGE